MNSGLSSIRRDLLDGWANRNVSLPAWAFLVPVAGVIFAEGTLFFGHGNYALSFHLLTLLFCVLAPIRNEETLALLQPFALLPLFRIVNLGMPTFFDLTLLFFPLTYLPMLPALYLVIRSQDIEIGWNPRVFAIGLVPIIVLSAPLAAGEYVLITPEALIPEPSPLWILGLAAIMIGAVGLVEELLFRGILQRRFAAYLGRWGGVLLASLLFGSMHSIYGSGIHIAYICFLGVVFGAVYEWTDSMGLVTVLHGVLNVFLFGLIPVYRPDLVGDLLALI